MGSDADITVLDPGFTGKISAANQHQKVDYTPYEGFDVKCRVDTVLLNGEIAVEDGKVVAEKQGRFVSRGPSQFWR